MSYILHLKPNRRGRDFVVGDIHGQYGPMRALLDEVKFNPVRDRCISVGDLMDRGPQSREVWELFRGKGFYSIKGNHEEMLEMCLNLRFRHPGPTMDPGLHIRNGGGWAFAYSPAKEPEKVAWFKQLRGQLEKLPLAVVVGAGTPARYNVVHTEFLHDSNKPCKVTDLDIDNWDFDAQGLYGTLGIEFLWRRRIVQSRQLLLQQGPGMSITYSGHIALATGHPVQLGRQILLDTGAGYMGADATSCLCMIEIGSQTVHRAGPDGKCSVVAVEKLAV